ncbi:hypothetical protein ISN45_Aa02g026820 [Arabidopsis thaliana x Arabidopsis arenosa]|uniref:Uncharacterized protein n=1 Tax=Arabidopsis thaliana x Arabidopsis arenosa TaxID=1240361 RepID=A0A8T2BJA7_9BRAS|nr:hypothetical protein ISN45_Aa02g026820 [Arabidopsis thaliana x Arabidopsis arenosa]
MREIWKAHIPSIGLIQNTLKETDPFDIWKFLRCITVEHQCTGSSWKGKVAEVSKTVSGESSDISTMCIMKMVGLRKTTKLNTNEQHDDRHKQLKAVGKIGALCVNLNNM